MEFVEGEGGVVLNEICRGRVFAEGPDEGAADHG